MILEMQFKSDPIKKLVRNAAKAARAVVTDFEANFYVDHIETEVPTLNASSKLSPLAGETFPMHAHMKTPSRAPSCERSHRRTSPIGVRG